MRTSIIISTAFALVASARSLETRQGVDCQAAYNSCLGFGRPEVACQCELATCSGQDNARNREFCATATAGLASTTTTTSTTTGAAATPTAVDGPCQATYNTCIASGRAEVACQCDLATCSGQDNARTREFCASATRSLGTATSTTTATASPTGFVTPCQATFNTCVASGRAQVACECDLATCSGQDNARTRERCAAATANLGTTTTATNGPSGAPNTPVPGADKSIPLGQPCSETRQCAAGECFASNAMLVKQCGNFNAQCTSNAQCAYNTCNNGLCNGFLNTNAPTSAPTSAPNAAPTTPGGAAPTGAAPTTPGGGAAPTTPAGTSVTRPSATTSAITQFTGAASKEQVGAGVALFAALFAAAL